ncbi:MAG: bifunctional hydroxymethylpyrimidine kinase/phosphomethylpyrimidine kinase [Erythrobacter sp.]|jgi:hydroxymethylpyrimidine/phosphomethylpyrimidine kinase|nr:bifunctional hydroxymethylpyrimidine kinase/phosphomethylpyrimidine kinase [Erythrobacter sp.]
MTTRPPPRILTIAGSDSSGGAGIQADIKTITMLGGYAMSAITTVTAQNSVGVQAIAPMSAEMVALQIEACVSDIGVDAIKLGMLHDEEIIAAVADALACVNTNVPVILDPVMVASSGAVLIADEAIEVLRERLFARASLITPNLPELEHLHRRTLRDTALVEAAARALVEDYGCAVLAKGGHTKEGGAPGGKVLDILVTPPREGEESVRRFQHSRIDTPHTHGTGCTLSAAIATLMGHGQPLEHAVRLGRGFVRQAILAAPGFGAGNGPLGHQAVRKLSGE